MIRTFDLERIQSLHENQVLFNLTESGFHPYSINELLNRDQKVEINTLQLGYGQTNGSVELRRKIAGLYHNLDEDNIIVSNGSSEANFIACHSLVEKGDEVAMMVPNYMQIWGIVEEMGAIPKAFHLLEEKSWAPDLDELRQIVNDKTKMIAICNPNNPTGNILTDSEMAEIVEIAESVGAWIYCDEVYRGAELSGIETPSFIGKYDKVLVTGGLSKAYALPGLRLGWLAGPKETIENAWTYHDYTSISPGLISQKIAEFALETELRNKILTRNRELLRVNLKAMQKWVDSQEREYRFAPPKGGGMAFLSYDFELNSRAVSDYLREEHSLFIAAGEWFGMEGFIRIGIGAETEFLKMSLELLEIGIEDLFTRNLL